MAKKNVRFKRMPINRLITKTNKRVPTKEGIIIDDVCTDQSKISDNIISTIMLGMAVYKLFK